MKDPAIQSNRTQCMFALISASIVSDASIDGDGYTKPLFMMGHDDALAWINAHEGLEGLVVDMDGAITQSDGCNAELL